MKYIGLAVALAVACTTQTTPQQDQASLEKRVQTTCPDYSSNAPTDQLLARGYCSNTMPDLSCMNDALASKTVAVMMRAGLFGAPDDPNGGSYVETTFAADGRFVDIFDSNSFDQGAGKTVTSWSESDCMAMSATKNGTTMTDASGTVPCWDVTPTNCVTK
jgi:hypothetical protein